MPAKLQVNPLIQPNYQWLPMEKALAFFRSKVSLPTNAWDDIVGRQHQAAFVVAGANKMAIVESFREAIDKAIELGTSLQEFRKDFDKIVDATGWSYKGSRGWRSHLIYDSNMRQTYNCAREDQMQDPAYREARPYAQYVHSGKPHFRPLHKSWNGLTLPTNDPWWATHTPQNGHGCGCKKIYLSSAGLQRAGKNAPDTAPDDGTYEYRNKKTGEVTILPKGIDYGFQFGPCDSVARNRTPQPLKDPIFNTTNIPAQPVAPQILPARPFDPQLLLPPAAAGTLTESDYINAFLGRFGASMDNPVVVQDKMDESLQLGKELFLDRSGKHGGEYKAIARGRERYLPMLAETIKDPDEIWVRMEWHAEKQKYVVRRRYIANWALEDGTAGLAVFETGLDGWAGITSHQTGDMDYLAKSRQGIQLYRRSEAQK
jgi:hypothetical protein